jgi:hypothetical protein
MSKESVAQLDAQELLRSVLYLCEEVMAGGQTNEAAIEKIRIAVQQYALTHDLKLSGDAENDLPENTDVPF